MQLFCTHKLISPSDAYMRQWNRISICLDKPVMGYCQLDPSEQTSVKF